MFHKPSHAKLRLDLYSEKASYRVREPLILNAIISNVSSNVTPTNLSDKIALLENNLDLHAHIRINAEDEEGNPVGYRYQGTRKVYAVSRSVGDFIKLYPGYMFGRSNISRRDMAFKQPGKITLRAVYKNIVDPEDILSQIGMHIWSGEIEAEPITVEII